MIPDHGYEPPGCTSLWPERFAMMVLVAFAAMIAGTILGRAFV